MSHFSVRPGLSTSTEAAMLTSLFNLAASGSGFAIAKNSDNTFTNVSVGGTTSLTVGTTAISSGTTGRLLYDNAGVLGEMTTTGSGTVAVLATSPTLVTPALGVAAATSLAIGGATIGSQVLSVTGSSAFTANINGGASFGSLTFCGDATGSTSANVYMADSVGVRTRAGNTYSWAAATSASAAGDTFIGRQAAANVRLGAADAAAPVAQTFSVQSVVTATSNTAGAAFTITGSQSTGTGVGGSIIFQTSPAGGAGSSVNALATVLTLDSTKLATFAGAISVTGHTTFEGVTSTGATGTGKLVYDGTPTLVSPLLGTPTSGNLANCTFPTLNQNTSGSAASLSISGQTGLLTFTGLASTSRIKTVRDAADTILELGGSYTPSGTWTSLTMVTPVLGIPTSGTLTNCTGLPVSGITASTSTALGVGSIELGHATDTTIARVSSGVVSIEGVNVMTVGAAQTVTGQNKFNNIIDVTNAITASANAATVPVTFRLSTVTNNSAATLTITMTTTSAVDGQMTMVRIYDFSGVAQTITWVNTENSTATAPTTSNGSTTLPLTVGFMYNSATSKWRCIASA